MWPIKREELTPEQRARSVSVIQEWVGIGLSTDPADHQAAEEGVRQAYARAGLPPPRRMIWKGSPLAGALLAVTLRRWVGNRLWDRLRAAFSRFLPLFHFLLLVAWVLFARRPESTAMVVLYIVLGGALLSLVDVESGVFRRNEIAGWTWRRARFSRRPSPSVQVADHVRDKVEARLGNPVADRIWSAVLDEVGDEVARQGLRALGGPREAGRLAFQCILRGRSRARLDGLVQVAHNAGCWWPFRDVAVLTERPTRLCLDDDGQLHAARGPAIVYPDGWAIWAWHGVRVPRWVIDNPERLTVARIQAQKRIDVRRAMIDRYGLRRYVQDAGALKIATDEYGTLWRCPLLGDEPLVMVEVCNATPEPDGSFRNYWLRVPPDVRTPREAIAWTFGVDAHDYDPEVQT